MADLRDLYSMLRLIAQPGIGDSNRKKTEPTSTSGLAPCSCSRTWLGTCHATAKTSQLEAHHNMELPRDMAVLPWPLNYAADTLKRHKLGDDGKTA